jgi:ribose transport system ATP-binding protein
MSSSTRHDPVRTDPAPTEPDPSTVLLRLEGIGKSFPGVRALDDVTLHVRSGEVHGVVGENGAGKSTLMAVASGALVPDDGTVAICGEALRPGDGPDAARERGLAIVRQEPALLPDLTVAENMYLAVPAHLRPRPGAAVAWADAQLARWGDEVPVRGSDRVGDLVPQQRFVVEICRALAQAPRVLVLDEPTEHLVREEVDLLFEHVRSLAATGTAVVYISHRIHEVKTVSDRVTVLRNGRTRGTHDARTLSEDDIVTLIVGRELDALFPGRGSGSATGDGLLLTDFATEHLAPLRLEVRAGEIVGLAGIEGNGQRDLLRALAGLQPSRGSVHVGGTPVRPGHSGGRLAYLSGDRHTEGVLTGLSVRENIAVRNLGALTTAGLVSPAKERHLVDSVIERFAVRTPRADTPIESLSGGNQQKALLGGVLAGSPPVLLVDEPTQGVDVGAKSEVYQVLRQAADAGAAVLVVSSDALELAGLSDRVLVFSRGHVVDEITGDGLSESAITAAALTAETERTRLDARRGGIARFLAADNAPPLLVTAVLAILVAVTTIANPVFLGERNLTVTLALTATLAFVALGQMLVMLTGGIDLSVGPLMGLTVVFASFFLVDGTPAGAQLFGWIGLLVLPLVVGAVNWVLVDLVGLHAMVGTLVTYMGLQGVSLVLRPVPGGVISNQILDPLGADIGPLPMTFLVAVVVTAALAFVIARTRWGISVRAVGSSSERAALNGLSPRLLRLSAHLGCSLLAGVAGITLMVQIASGDATAGIAYTLTSITAAVVGGTSAFGGRGSVVGALLGALLVQVVSAVTTFLQAPTAVQYYLIGGMALGAVALYSRGRVNTRRTS